MVSCARVSVHGLLWRCPRTEQGGALQPTLFAWKAKLAVAMLEK